MVGSNSSKIYDDRGSQKRRNFAQESTVTLAISAQNISRPVLNGKGINESGDTGVNMTLLLYSIKQIIFVI